MIGSFIVATALITLLPGPSMLVIAACALDRGWRAGMAATGGVVLADAILLAIALSGVGALAQASPMALHGLKWLGTAYLLYLGVGLLRARSGGTTTSGGPGGAFRRGLMATLPNPKIIAFLIVYFPQFMQPGRDTVGQLLVLGPLFLLTVGAVFLLCVAAVLTVGRALPRGGEGWLNRACGCCLIACGLYSALV
ncbi:LysE family translocator [Chromobacterium sp. IIBBL 290-4]|uniref:LysE family translocator n=1 Tax=Chromobacterium sp. IIBBL 290-4 TaxID=2953890 RepID=UPI0020B7D993|nr:LysE family translocator [Chromobacterium sp. IIBBL 290-4]UTH74696.1 LysE family translocator [Chromobacterium sp. IIBBL 290-4]